MVLNILTYLLIISEAISREASIVAGLSNKTVAINNSRNFIDTAKITVFFSFKTNTISYFSNKTKTD